MEEKKVKAGSIAIGICLFVIAILLVLIVLFFYNSNLEKNRLQNKISELENTIKEKESRVNKLKEKNYKIISKKILDRLELPDKDYSISSNLKCYIDTTKKVENVNNYASTMKWNNYTMEEFVFEYPSGWKVQKMNDGVEEVRISGSAVGKNLVGVGENGDKVVSSDMLFIVYKPIECTQEEVEIFCKEKGFTEPSIIKEFYKNEDYVWEREMDYSEDVDCYCFFDIGGKQKLVRIRILYAYNSMEYQTCKTVNIESHLLYSFNLIK
ncbi:MAG: hypothetical protein ACI4UE_01670 [Candidatus Scatovivens sp.]